MSQQLCVVQSSELEYYFFTIAVSVLSFRITRSVANLSLFIIIFISIIIYHYHIIILKFNIGQSYYRGEYKIKTSSNNNQLTSNG